MSKPASNKQAILAAATKQGPAAGDEVLDYVYIYIYIWPWVTNNVPSLFRKNIDLGAILDADLDAQRDFAPQCIIQKQNSSISEV